MKINTKQDLQYYLDNRETRSNAISYVQCLLDERYDWVNGVWSINPNAPYYALGLPVEEAVALGCEDRVIAEPERMSAAEMEAAEAIASAKVELAQLDQQSIRPASAIAAALASGVSPDAADVARLTELEAAKVVQRAVIQEAGNE